MDVDPDEEEPENPPNRQAGKTYKARTEGRKAMAKKLRNFCDSQRPMLMSLLFILVFGQEQACQVSRVPLEGHICAVAEAAHVPGWHGVGDGLIAATAFLHKMRCRGLSTHTLAGMAAGVILAMIPCCPND